MIIITDYSLEHKADSDSFYVRSRETLCCPYCDARLKVVGSRKRGLWKKDGSSIQLIIRRLQCRQCMHIHHELPDMVVPYKRYDSETITAVLASTNTRIADYPCEQSTAIRIKLWFFLLHDYFENTLHSLIDLHNIITIEAPLYPTDQQPDGWRLLATLSSDELKKGKKIPSVP